MDDPPFGLGSSAPSPLLYKSSKPWLAPFTSQLLVAGTSREKRSIGVIKPPDQTTRSADRSQLFPQFLFRRSNQKQAMKQKIVIKVSMSSEKSRSKAMELVARADGVSSMGVTGNGKDQLEVVGDGVDTVCLVKCLRKKLGHADILKVEEVKDKKPEEKKPEEPKVVDLPPYYYPGYYYHHHHLPAPWW
ncbi:hypothetical protein SEVIR_7G140300v4 [Setaria viridis]|uniref:HMA domain-containing protein n=3 Tax=Setaria TaxID=4554 RepID=A0A368RV66_SETIT|nr:heavy metal-associated isoprenylated plant protein 16 [Setaria italica]XP_034604442.1 heavy metal-associated isoprenylated plant protein 16-like [Setaria viridis]RCV34049.1 hypothetical protein SETIT_7G131700v2 [Setaria italica]TKW04891.1 hypothetical protein SEVIR_7G140300v2 [Setaria viridis]